MEIKSCPFCGGNGKVSFKDYRYIGHSAFGDKKVCYRVQVICNKCRSRGRPVITEALINPNPYSSKWGNCFGENPAQTKLFEPFVEQAIAAWNTRK